jgi:hypothetical protein
MGMKPETERLLQECRAKLLQFDNEQLHSLFVSWLERMIGEDEMEETLDDLCLLLGYGVRSANSPQVYGTYTAWWEVEGYAVPDGEFVCLDMAALQQELITMPIRQFHLITELAFQVCVQDAEAESQPGPPIEQEFLRALAAWFESGALSNSMPWNHQQTPPSNGSSQHHGPAVRAFTTASQPLTKKQRKVLQRQHDRVLIEQACQQGYLLIAQDTSHPVQDQVKSRCKQSQLPYIAARKLNSQLATLLIDLSPLRKTCLADRAHASSLPGFTLTLAKPLQERLKPLAERYSPRPETGTAMFTAYGEALELPLVALTELPDCVQDFMALWPDIMTDYQAQLEAHWAVYQAQLEVSRLAAIERQREWEESRRPAWKRTITRLSAQEERDWPDLPEAVVLPEEWETLISKEGLAGFLSFLKQPVSSRDIKPRLLQQLSICLETQKNARALFFEVFAFDLALPPWELETRLGCSTSERRRWTEEEKLPVVGYGSFRKAGSDHAYPRYDRRVILTLTTADIERWRAEHKALLRERRRVASQAAATRRKAEKVAD